MKAVPEHLNDAGRSYSNFDHEEPEGMEIELKAGEVYCLHPAWEHHGTMWFENGEFHEEVHRYGVHVDTQTAATLKELFDAVNEKWGEE